MAEEQLREIIDAMRARIQAELDAQITALTTRHEEALTRARQEAVQAAEAEAEKRWTSKLDALRNEWNARLQGEIAAAKAEAEKRFVAESMRARDEAEKGAAEAASRARRELDQALAAERQRSQAVLDEERHRAEAHLQQALEALEAERRELEAQSQARIAVVGLDADALVKSTRVIDNARSLSDALATLVHAAGTHAPRVALFIVNGTQLDEWSVPGVPPTHTAMDLANPEAGLLGTAVRGGNAVRSSADDPRLHAPAFADLPPDRHAVAVPLVLGGQAVAVLYADEGNALASHATPGWGEAVELLGRYAAAAIAHMTAVRTLQLSHGSNGHDGASSDVRTDDDLGARRYAKLLVSEIKLYNEAAVRAGREHRDLRQRLAGEIERARRLYEERVSPSVAARGFYFQQELVQTLAGGDPSLLGG